MTAVEIVEVVVMNAVVLAWLLYGLGAITNPAHVQLLYWGSPVPVLIILIRRLVLYNRALRDVDSAVDAQRPPTVSIAARSPIPPHLERRASTPKLRRSRREPPQ